jgi:hypothetical protein
VSSAKIMPLLLLIFFQEQTKHPKVIKLMPLTFSSFSLKLYNLSVPIGLHCCMLFTHLNIYRNSIIISCLLKKIWKTACFRHIQLGRRLVSTKRLKKLSNKIIRFLAQLVLIDKYFVKYRWTTALLVQNYILKCYNPLLYRFIT